MLLCGFQRILPFFKFQSRRMCFLNSYSLYPQSFLNSNRMSLPPSKIIVNLNEQSCMEKTNKKTEDESNEQVINFANKRLKRAKKKRAKRRYGRKINLRN